jgi:hypothetical protein
MTGTSAQAMTMCDDVAAHRSLLRVCRAVCTTSRQQCGCATLKHAPRVFSHAGPDEDVLLPKLMWCWRVMRVVRCTRAEFQRGAQQLVN